MDQIPRYRADSAVAQPPSAGGAMLSTCARSIGALPMGIPDRHIVGADVLPFLRAARFPEAASAEIRLDELGLDHEHERFAAVVDSLEEQVLIDR